jgi:hypothetical protein
VALRLIAPFTQVRVVHAARCTRRILARTLGDEVSNIRHQQPGVQQGTRERRSIRTVMRLIRTMLGLTILGADLRIRHVS